MTQIEVNNIELLVGQYVNQSRVQVSEVQLDFFKEVKKLKPALTDDEFCLLIGVTRKTLNNKICQGGQGCLPKYIKVPGGRRRLWLISDVAEWLGQREVINHEQ